MSPPAAFKASFADFKIVRGRKVGQFVFELPLEQADAALNALGGLPRPDAEAWAAIARLDLSKAIEEPTKPTRAFAELPIAQQAALLCNRAAFQKFTKTGSSEEAAEYLRTHCGVKSRSELASNARAAGKFQTLTHEFDIWLAAPL